MQQITVNTAHSVLGLHRRRREFESESDEKEQHLSVSRRCFDFSPLNNLEYSPATTSALNIFYLSIWSIDLVCVTRSVHPLPAFLPTSLTLAYSPDMAARGLDWANFRLYTHSWNSRPSYRRWHWLAEIDFACYYTEIFVPEVQNSLDLCTGGAEFAWPLRLSEGHIWIKS